MHVGHGAVRGRLKVAFGIVLLSHAVMPFTKSELF